MAGPNVRKVREEGVNLETLNAQVLRTMPDAEFRATVSRILELQQRDRRENQLLYYRPVSSHAEQVHLSTAKFIGVGGGNGSSKTETCLAHLCMMATGAIPKHLGYLKEQFRGPISCRIVLESLTTVLHPVILPKMQWWKWTGVGEIGGNQGHWGWIPKLCLIDASWERSWSEKLRILRVLCRDPDNFDKVLGESSIQFNSHDQDPSDFASGDFHIILHDEPPRHPIWIENEARTMRVNGRMFLAMTWPDDPAIPVDWIYDELYDKGKPGPKKSPHHDWFELYTVDNPHLNQDSVKLQMENWSDEMQNVRIFGQPIRFSNRIHPLYTDVMQIWCFNCGKNIYPVDNQCPSCKGDDFHEYVHQRDFEHATNWPTVWVLDPHPRKPHMFMWVQIDPSDDLWVVADGECEGDPGEVHEYVSQIEESMSLTVAMRLMDPNMGRSPAGARREVTWQDEFDQAGLVCDLADDSDVGRGRVNEYLRPDRHTLAPRLHIHARCTNTNFQMKRYTWDEYKKAQEREQKQKPRPKYDDYPTMLKYLLNAEPNYSWLNHGAPVLSRPGKRRGAY